MGDSVDAIIMPVISRQFIKKGKNKILKFAGKDLTLHPNFKLFLQTNGRVRGPDPINFPAPDADPEHWICQ